MNPMINLDRIGKAKADLLSAERQIRALLADGKEAYRTDPKGPPALKYLLPSYPVASRR